MIFYNWKLILRESKYSIRELLKTMKYITFKPQIYNEEDPFYSHSQIDWSGESFLLNPKLLFINRPKHLDKHLVEYIALASLRNYGNYVSFNDLTLDLLICKDREDLINKNSLLLIKDEKVYFRYEEAPKE